MGATDAKKAAPWAAPWAAPNTDTNTENKLSGRKFIFNIDFCTENCEIVDIAALDSSNMKVEGIACYGCNLLVLMRRSRQVALTPGIDPLYSR